MPDAGILDCWLVIPAYREGHRLPSFLERLLHRLNRCAVQVAVLVVDDGSPPAEQCELEVRIGEIRKKQVQLRPLVCLPENRGKGASIYTGWDRAEPSRYLGFVDADGAVSPDEVARVLDMVRSSGHPPCAYFASRIKMLGRKIERKPERHLIGRIFATMVGLLLGIGVYDSQCGFKIIPSGFYGPIKPLLQEPRFAFDVELLAALRHVGCPVVEVPIDWHDTPGSKVRLIRDSWDMARAVMSLSRRMKRWM